MRNAVGKWNNQTQGKPVKSKFESAPMPKDAMGEAEGFDSWRNQHQHQGYSTTVSANNMQDPYNAQMPSYYGVSFPYQNVGMGGGEGHWSSGGDPMTFLGSYGQQLSSEQQHYMDSSMYSSGAFGGFNQQPGYNQFYGMSDYSAWGNSSVNRKPATHGHYGYYDRDVYSDQGVDRSCVKPVEQAMQGLSIVDKSDSNPGAEGGSEYSGRGAVSDGSNIPKKTWASIASQPAKPQPKIRSKGMPPPPMIPGKHVDIGTWDSRSATNAKPMNPPQSRAPWGAPRGRGGPPATTTSTPPSSNSNQNSGATGNGTSPQHPVLEKLRQSNEYNPKDYDLSAKNARFFVIKSYSEDDIHRSIKYGIWCSTEHGNKRLDGAFHERESKGMVLLFFSVNGSGHFCGMAMMTSPLDYNSSSSVWAQDKWKGQFNVKWIYVKDVPNAQLRNIRLENNENKPVTNSRDTQEVPFEKGKQVLKIIHNYRHSTSIFDDFIHYEQRQEEGAQHAHSSEEQL